MPLIPDCLSFAVLNSPTAAAILNHYLPFKLHAENPCASVAKFDHVQSWPQMNTNVAREDMLGKTRANPVQKGHALSLSVVAARVFAEDPSPGRLLGRFNHRVHRESQRTMRDVLCGKSIRA